MPDFDRDFPLRRSVLFVPGDDPRKMQRAAETGADTLVFDLEDAVAPDDKAQARKNIIEALNDVDWGDKTLSVRMDTQCANALTIARFLEHRGSLEYLARRIEHFEQIATRKEADRKAAAAAGTDATPGAEEDHDDDRS